MQTEIETKCSLKSENDIQKAPITTNGLTRGGYYIDVDIDISLYLYIKREIEKNKIYDRDEVQLEVRKRHPEGT